MEAFIPVSPNMVFEPNPAFGNFDNGIIFGLFRLVDENFSKALEKNPYSSKPCIISYNHFLDMPMCCREGDCHHIYLRCESNFWCQWMFQFAHEYCHHLIDGELTGDISGLIWFEECVCELSSMYHLRNLALYFATSSQEHLLRYAPSVHNYLGGLMDVEMELVSETTHPGILHRWGTLLQEPKYHRLHYRAIAARMFPLFVENPHLWKIILHFGDMRQWESPDELFQHLRQNATADYAHSLEKLHLLLLS